ncbi:MAG: type II secretion system minor pseudopilin GspK [Steroidobacteraceae bacterium]
MKSRQRGVILISALILVALAAIVATALFFDTALAARRAAASFSMEQAVQLGAGGEALAAYALAEDKNSEDSSKDSWAQHYGPVEVEDGVTLEAQIGDEQGKFNLNTLLRRDGTPDPDAVKVLRRLLELSDLEPRWASLIIDWIDPNNQPEADGGEDSLYLSQTPPHRAGNLLLTSVSELQQLPGFTLEMYRKLLPHVTALPPEAQKINVCTADGVVLDALFALSTTGANNVQYSRLSAEDMARSRAQGCFPRKNVIGATEPQIAGHIDERSSYFRLQTWLSIGTAQFALYSLMYRDGAGKVRPILRTMGTE